MAQKSLGIKGKMISKTNYAEKALMKKRPSTSWEEIAHLEEETMIWSDMKRKISRLLRKKRRKLKCFWRTICKGVSHAMDKLAERLLDSAKEMEDSIAVNLSSWSLEVSRFELLLQVGTFCVAIGALAAGIFG